MLAILFATLLAAPPASDTPSQSIAIMDSRDRINASAVLVTPYMVLTAAHAVGELYSLVYVTCGNVMIGGEVIKRSLNPDLALIQLPVTCSAVKPAVLEATDPAPDIDVEVEGFPARVHTVATGRTAGYATFGCNHAAGQSWLALIVVFATHATAPGSSGGPVTSVKTGKLVGIIHGAEERLGKWVAGAVPASAIREFLETPPGS